MEKAILILLSKSNSEIGFRQIHSELKNCSKTTLSNSLKLLVTQHKILPTKNRKYKINPEKDLLVNVKRLGHLLKHISDYFPKLSRREEAFLGLKLWTLIFQNESHPAKFFVYDKYGVLSYDGTKSKRTKTIREFFESKNETSIFDDSMYELFFDFCSKYSPKELRDVFSKILESELYTPISKKNSFLSLASDFQSVITVRRSDFKTYYGLAFCNLLHSLKPALLTKQNLEKIKKDMIMFNEKFIDFNSEKK